MEDELKQSLVTGLTSSPKYIPTWYLYDDVGSRLQQTSITKNPDYYLTRSQISILDQSVQDIIPMDSPNDHLTLVDLGSGDCAKTRFIIDELLKRQKTLTFYPVDIAGEFLMREANILSDEYDDSLVVQPIAADYVHGIEHLKRVKGAKLILWFGSMFNLSYDDQVDTIRMISTMMTDKCRLVISTDITQDREAILKAYNGDDGLMRSFIQHAIARLNKEEESQIDLARFTYEVDFISDTNPQYMSYVRAYIKAKEYVRCPIPDDGKRRLYCHEGDGFSCKYTLEQLQNIVEKAGLRLTKTWTNKQQHAVLFQCKNCINSKFQTLCF